MASRQYLAADSANGTVDVDGVLQPALTRDQTVALVEYWRDQAQRNKQEPHGDWYRVLLPAIGYEKPGDKFQSDRLFQSKYASAMLPAEYLPETWAYVHAAARDLEDAKAPPHAWEPSSGVKARWGRMARVAWKRMKVERAAAAAAAKAKGDDFHPAPTPIPKKIPKSPVDPRKGMPRNPFKGAGVLFIIALLALGDRS